MTPHRPPGLYEELVTRRLEAALGEIRGEGWRDEIESLDPAEAPKTLERAAYPDTPFSRSSRLGARAAT